MAVNLANEVWQELKRYVNTDVLDASTHLNTNQLLYCGFPICFHDVNLQLKNNLYDSFLIVFLSLRLIF